MGASIQGVLVLAADGQGLQFGLGDVGAELDLLEGHRRGPGGHLDFAAPANQTRLEGGRAAEADGHVGLDDLVVVGRLDGDSVVVARGQEGHDVIPVHVRRSAAGALEERGRDGHDGARDRHALVVDHLAGNRSGIALRHEGRGRREGD